MILFLSGQDGVKREIPETVLDDANVMLSYNTAVVIQEQDKKPNGRMQRLFKARRKVKRNED